MCENFGPFLCLHAANPMSPTTPPPNCTFLCLHTVDPIVHDIDSLFASVTGDGPFWMGRFCLSTRRLVVVRKHYADVSVKLVEDTDSYLGSLARNIRRYESLPEEHLPLLLLEEHPEHYSPHAEHNYLKWRLNGTLDALIAGVAR